MLERRCAASNNQYVTLIGPEREFGRMYVLKWPGEITQFGKIFNRRRMRIPLNLSL